jgi:oxepin-CoA hydrolase/3-oxo-5,6-dehydrosuberyl-CoA semialdehyde dehydrogenase
VIIPLDLTGASTRRLKNYICGDWAEGTGRAATLVHAVTGAEFAEASTSGIDMKRVVDHARTVGGPKLRAMTFHQRALMLKAVAKHLKEKKDELYRV